MGLWPNRPTKKKKKIRLIGDYRKLNSQTIPDRYPIPVIYDAISFLKNKCIFSKIDLIRAFHNIPVYEAHIEKTAVISPAGLYEHVRMPFGLRNGPSVFQRFMNSVLSELPFCTVYIDDILIFSESVTEHYAHIEVVFQRLQKFGLAINLNKCSFGVTELDFLGYHITPNGFAPTSDRIAFIKEMKPPSNITTLRRILGLLNFYRQFTKNAAETLAPLQELLKGHPRKNDRTKIQWTTELEKNFDDAKAAFARSVQLNYQRRGAALCLTCDASRTAIGAVLEQVNDKGEKEPLGFFSKKLTDREKKWPVYDLELLAIYAAAEHFEPLIAGRDLTIVTDHRPLTYLFTTKKKDKIERRSRYAEYIGQFSTKIVHVAGATNLVADALSRPEEDVEMARIDAKVSLQLIAKAQGEDDDVQRWRREGYRDQTLREVKIGNNESVLCSKFQGVDRPIIPKKMQHQIFLQVHNIAHNGLKATLRLIRSRYYWPKMTADIRKWHRTCKVCQLVKVTRHSNPERGQFPQCKKFEHVHLDLVGPMRPSRGYTHLCTFIDRTSRWIEAVPLTTTTAETVAKAFYTQWIARYGTPLKITTDRGPQFRSELFGELAKLLGAQHIQTTAYHPQANGMIERVHRRLKEMLICHAADWSDYLPAILLGLRAAPRDESGNSCAELVFGQGLRLPGEMFQTTQTALDTTDFVRQLRKTLQEIKPEKIQEQRNKKFFVRPDLATCKRVYVRVDRVKASLEAPYQGPYEVVRRSKHFYELDIDGKRDTVSLARLKPAYEICGERGEVEKNEQEKIRPILKKTGNPYSTVREGQTITNTNLNAKTIYINSEQGENPNFPFMQYPEVQQEREHRESVQTRASVSINAPNPQPPNQNIRQSNRVRKPPSKYSDYVRS